MLHELFKLYALYTYYTHRQPRFKGNILFMNIVIFCFVMLIVLSCDYARYVQWYLIINTTLKWVSGKDVFKTLLYMFRVRDSMHKRQTHDTVGSWPVTEVCLVFLYSTRAFNNYVHETRHWNIILNANLLSKTDTFRLFKHTRYFDIKLLIVTPSKANDTSDQMITVITSEITNLD